MKKIIAVAALLAASVAVPVLPTQAATVSEVVDSCLVLPLLKRECWDMARDNAEAVTAAAVSTTDAAVEASWPVWWQTCERAAAGSGHLYDCE